MNIQKLEKSNNMPPRKCEKSKHYKLLCTNSIIVRRTHVMSKKLVSIQGHLDVSNHQCVDPTKDLSTINLYVANQWRQKFMGEICGKHLLTSVGLFSHLYIIRFSMKLERKRMKTIINPGRQTANLLIKKCNSAWIVPQKSHLSKLSRVIRVRVTC